MVRVSARLELTTVGVSKKTNYINGSLPTLVQVPGGDLYIFSSGSPLG